MLEYLKLEVRRTLRNRRYLVFSIGLPLFFYLLFSKLYGSVAGLIDDVPYTAYIMISMAAYGTLGTALNSGGPRLAEERANGWMRQLRITPLTPAGYLVGKILSAVVLTLPVLVLIGEAAHFVNGVRLPVVEWAQALLLLVIGVLPFAAPGVLLGLLFDVDSAQPAMLIVYLGLSLLGGLWMPVASMPHTMQEIAHAMPTYRYAELARARRALAAAGVEW